MLTLPNYQISHQIYESINSIIFKGLKKKDNQQVILKMLKQDYPTPAELIRYQQEYEIIRDFDLVGVIKVYSIEKYQNTFVIILEDFGGESLKAIFEEKPEGLVIADFLPLAIQIAHNLGQIHAAHIIHKDINPANIVWNQNTNQLKIIDFGIASRLPRENPTLKNPEQLEGTLPYLSPEQTGRMNRALDYRTDLYSLGVTFYELLTRKVPYESDNALELVHCHIAKTPVPVSQVNFDVPPIISDLVMKLMAKNAEERYQSAYGVKVDLEKCLENLPYLADLSFELAQNDFSGQLQIPEKLYGRENEINTLLQAFERVNQGASEMILVAGYSGVGKTALVNEIHKPMTEKQGYFAAGKFDQLKKNIPYSAITQAFNSLCRYLLKESAESLAAWQAKILAALGNNGQVIIDVIPDLELVIGKQPAVTQVNPTETKDRFQMFFLNFVKALCDKDHPFILFIDDLQWTDLASLDLLKNMMLDGEIKYLLIIGSYRTNEVDSNHPFIVAVNELQKANAIINTIELANLLPKDINHLLQESLLCEAIQSQSLTDLIDQKTQGNAFFTHQFLHTLYAEALLSFDFDTHQWQWDVSKIAAKDMTDNVVELMANKIAKLPINTQQVLKLAACIGNSFDLNVLSIIYQQDTHSTRAELWEAINELLIVPLDHQNELIENADTNNARFQFQHDRIQQAAYSLIAEADKPALHRKIGELLLAAHPNDWEESIFEIVDHLNLGIDLVEEQAEKNKIALLNLKAGQAKLATTYQAALEHLLTGIRLLDADSWKTEYQLTLHLYESATIAASLSGQFDQMEKWSDVVIQHATNTLDTVKVYETKIYVYTGQNRQSDAVKVGLQILKRLGVHFPESPTMLDIQQGYEKTQAVLQQQHLDSLLHLPIMTDDTALAVMRIITSVVPPSHQTASNLFPFLGYEEVNLSVKYGNCIFSPCGYADYGVILVGLFRQIELGYQFGQIALNLTEQLNAKETKSYTLFKVVAFTLYRKRHIIETVPLFQESYQCGLEMGMLEGFAHAASFQGVYGYFAGMELKQLAQLFTTNANRLRQIKRDSSLMFNQTFHQVVLNLLEKVENPDILTGSVSNEEELLKVQIAANGRIVLNLVYLGKSMLSYLFGKMTQALENTAQAEHYLDGMRGFLMEPMFYFYDSLIQLKQYSSESNLEKQQQILFKVTENQNNLNHWAPYAPMNFQHKYDLVEAEKARVLGQLNAIEWYEKAINGAKKNEYLNEEALAYELAAQFYLERRMEKFAQTYLKQAHYCYQQWGALAKVVDLETKYPQLLTTPKNFSSTVTMRGTIMTLSATGFQTSTILDLDSITKASQTLAGEIILSKLLKKMMHLVIENAGAEHGFLLLPNDDQWVIEAEGAIDKKEVFILHSVPIENYLPAAIINYVARTQENVVLANASAEGLYTEDEYIKAHQTQSVLCFPIVYQQQLRAILYLENNLSPGAFTPQRLSVLQMLSSQIAISLENAEYASHLEEKVKQRTTELAQANQEIMALNDKLKEENLRMRAELEVAKQLQQMVLPKETELEQIKDLDIAGFMTPADEVGGDYYEILNHNGRIKIGIGDVTGHGLESGVLMLMVQTTVRALLLAGIDKPEHFLNIINQTIYHNAQRMGTDKNLTLSLLDYQKGTLQITGQHEEVLLVRQSGQVERIDTFDLGYSVGVVVDIADWVAQTQISLQPGDGIVLYTDGITEAQNLAEELYGIDRLCEVVSRHWSLTAQAIQQAVVADVKQYIGTQKVFDDITLLVLKQK